MWTGIFGKAVASDGDKISTIHNQKLFLTRFDAAYCRDILELPKLAAAAFPMII